MRKDMKLIEIALTRYKREISAAAAYAALLLLVAFVRPSFFSAANLRDLVMNNMPVLIVAVGMTMVILAGQIDISVGSLIGVLATVIIVGATSMIPIAVWLDYKFRDKVDRLLDRR